jgi:endonuclease/exonuclease/phosphatase family metal-dependent hydrolase
MIELDCLTWNVHRGRGQDGRIDTDRTTDALAEIVRGAPPDLLVLTEADAEQPPYHGIFDLERIARSTGLTHVQSDHRLRWSVDSHGFLGTLVFLGPRLTQEGGHVMDLPGHYPRGASILTLAAGAARFRLIATHLSLTQVLRAAQMRIVGQYLTRAAAMPTLLVGDLNEWRPWGGIAFSRAVVGHRFTGPAVRSFPSARPVLPLDRILATAPATVLRAQAVTSPNLRVVSDHLPVRAVVKLP